MYNSGKLGIRCMTLPDNLTYGQFLDLADRTPSLEGLWIYPSGAYPSE